MDKKKIEKLRSYANEQGYIVDELETQRMRDALCDERINIRIPKDLKEKLIEVAQKKRIPYQRYIKSILIEALTKEKIVSGK